MSKGPDWVAIEGAYRAGVQSLRVIAKEYGTVEGTIRHRAKVNGWVQTPRKNNPLAELPEANSRKGFCCLIGVREAQDISSWFHHIVEKSKRANHEESVIAAIEMLVACEVLAGQMGWPRITEATKEYQFEIGRADFFLTHEDGSTTIIEAKREGSAARVASGIGQLFLYAAQSDTKARKVLAVGGYGSKPILDTCELAGVTLLAMGDMAARRKRYERALSVIQEAA